MSLLQTISDFLESIFKRSSPEVQKKQLLKKLDSEIREFIPSICRDGFLQPNFGEAIFALYKNTRPLDNLFAVTVSPNDMPRQHRFEAQLIATGYTREEQDILNSLTFQNRKLEVQSEVQNQDRVYIHQKSKNEKIIKALNSDNFKKMDKDILELRQFVEFCHYGFVPFLQIFDTGFVPADLSYIPNYAEIPVNKALNLLEDLYYQISGLNISTVTGEMVLALAQLKKGSELTPQERESYLGNIKKINYVITKIIPSNRLKTLIRYCKCDVNYEPQVVQYSGSPRQEFANMLQTRFETDEQRIKSELQDERISEDVTALFPGYSLDEVVAYNQKYNALLQADSSLSFQWILPMRILKTFLRHYLTDSVKTLLNNIVIEGFFNNPAYKTNFSSVVFSACNADVEVQGFEESFGTDQRNSIGVLESYIKDSKKDKDFYKRLEKLVSSINNDAYKIVQGSVTSLFSLYKEVGELLADAKKPSSEIISNLKVLMMSSRNRDNTNFLESQYGNWKIFFDIMKNYVIINSGEMQS